MKKTLLYFGCMKEVGHYLFENELFGAIHDPREFLMKTGVKNNLDVIFGKIDCGSKIDGGYTPKSITAQGAAKETVVSQFRIVAWHDYTVDRRGNSNSALIGVGYGSAEEMLADAASQFPTVMIRQPGPLNFVERQASG